MLPEHLISSSLVQGYYLYPDNLDPTPIRSYEYGGVALNDPSQGLRVQVWTLRLAVDGVLGTSNVYLSAPNTPEYVLYSAAGITEISLAFDQNMAVFFAFVQYGVAKYRWFDPTVSEFVITELPAGSVSPKCCLDDRREMQNGKSDILLAYVREGTLYYREQRDRYEIEYTLQAGITTDLRVVGMAKNNRVMFNLDAQEFPALVINYREDVLDRKRVTVGGDRRRIVGVSYG